MDISFPNDCDGSQEPVIRHLLRTPTMIPLREPMRHNLSFEQASITSLSPSGSEGHQASVHSFRLDLSSDETEFDDSFARSDSQVDRLESSSSTAETSPSLRSVSEETLDEASRFTALLHVQGQGSLDGLPEPEDVYSEIEVLIKTPAGENLQLTERSRYQAGRWLQTMIGTSA